MYSHRSQEHTLGTAQFRKKHAALCNPEVRNSVTYVIASVLDIPELQVQSPRASTFVKTVITDILTHGLSLMELDLVVLEKWIRDREAVLSDHTKQLLARLGAASSADIEFNPRPDYQSYVRQQWESTMAVVDACSQASATLAAVDAATDGIVSRINGLTDMLKRVRVREIIENAARPKQAPHFDAAGTHERNTNPSKRWKTEPPRVRMDGKAGPPEPGQVLEVRLDDWQYLFTGKPDAKVQPGSIAHLVDIVSRFFVRRDPCLDEHRIYRRPHKMCDVSHPLWKHTTRDGYVYHVPKRAAVPLLVETVDCELNVHTPVMSIWPVVEKQYIMDLTDKAVMAQHAARLIFASSTADDSAPATLREAREKTREYARRIRRDAEANASDSLIDDRATRAHALADPAEAERMIARGHMGAARAVQEVYQLLLRGMQDAADLEQSVRSYTGSTMLPATRAPSQVFEAAHEDFRTYGEHVKLQWLTGKRVTEHVTPSSYDPNYLGKGDRTAQQIHRAFSLTEALIEPSPSTKSTEFAKRPFELLVNETARNTVRIINALAELLGLPTVDISRVGTFEIKEATEEIEMKAAETRLTAAETALVNAKKPTPEAAARKK